MNTKTYEPLLTDFIKAGFPVLALNTFEPDRAEEHVSFELAGIAKFNSNWGLDLFAWDCVRGIKKLNSNSSTVLSEYLSAESAINYFVSDEVGPKSVLLMHNIHNFLDDPLLVQLIQNVVSKLKTSFRYLVFVCPDISIPIELERIVTVVEHTLPTINEIKSEYTKVIDEYNLEISSDVMNQSCSTASGMTMFEAENALMLSLIKNKTLVPDTIFEIKSQMIKKNGCLSICDFEETLDDLKGLDNLKEFGREVLLHEYSKGILITGIAGSGKSAFAKAIGKEIGLSTVSMDFGDMFGSHIGESEQKIKSSLEIIDAMAPMILFIDEIEKDLEGANSTGETDSGVTKRVLKKFLVWAEDRKSRVPIIATANGLSRIPPEFIRSERWDGIFFVDLPTRDEALEILKHYLKLYDHSEDAAFVMDSLDVANWTGAEIKTLCRLGAIFKDLEKAYKFVVPIYKSKKAEIDHIRKEASKFAIRATSIPSEDKVKSRRIMTD